MNIAIDSYGATDPGKRSSNEDQYLIADLRKALVIEHTSLPQDDGSCFWGVGQRFLYLVADGVAGAPDGQKASSVATAAIARHVLNTMPWFLSLREDDDDDLRGELRRAVEHSNEAVRNVDPDDLTNRQPTTTVTMAYVLWPRLYVVHAGDSRCYLYRSGEMRQVTNDHTVAQQLVERGVLDEQKAEESRWSNVLWNAVGGDDKGVIAEVHKATLWAGDAVLLCTDGVTKALSDERIAAILGDAASAAAASVALIAAAKDNGADDNATALVARFVKA
jgi:protein phosphatase